MEESLDTSLTRSIASAPVGDLLASIADTTIDAVVESGSLDGVPFFGLLLGGRKAYSAIRESLSLRKIVIFLQQFSSLSQEVRQSFIEGFSTPEEQHRFGQSVLLLLERAEDMRKPAIIGKLMAAAASGEIGLAMAMRLSKMVDKSYTEDLDYLKSLRPGIQGELTPIADALYSAGFLANCGIDGGDDYGNGGYIFELNEYGKTLATYGLN